MMNPDVKTKVDRLPTDGITPEMLDAVLDLAPCTSHALRYEDNELRKEDPFVVSASA